MAYSRSFKSFDIGTRLADDHTQAMEPKGIIANHCKQPKRADCLRNGVHFVVSEGRHGL